MTHLYHSNGTKLHAQRRDMYRKYPLWVNDEDDWNIMRSLPTGDLICPEDGCRTELVSVEKKNGTRFLKNRIGTAKCGHDFGKNSTGGKMSAEHRWFQQRLSLLCDILKYEAIQEHYYADVWVKAPVPLAIEVQKWNTDFKKRSDAHQSRGANTLWLFPESAESPQIKLPLFTQPAARLRVFKGDKKTEEARPWLDGHEGKVRLWVGATVMRPSLDSKSMETMGNYDALDFLREILKGDRRWYGEDDPYYKYFTYAGWAKPCDVERVKIECAKPLTMKAVISPIKPKEQPPVLDENKQNEELKPPKTPIDTKTTSTTAPFVEPLTPPETPDIKESAKTQEKETPLEELPVPKKESWLKRLFRWKKS